MDLTRGGTRAAVALTALSYLALGFALWIHAWTSGASSHTLCGCGDPALFLWFFQSPATSLAHLSNPFFSTALFHPTGINLLDQTSVLGLTVPLAPVTWLFGPVASLNLASTLVPALTALMMFLVLRRWVRWIPAAYLGGLLYGFSPFVLTNLPYAHLMTAALLLLPLILATLDEILVRQKYGARQAGVVLGLLLTAQFFLSSEVLVIVIMLAVFSLAVLGVAGLVAARERLWQLAPHAVRALGVGAVVGVVLLAYPVYFALAGPAHLSGAIWPNVGVVGGTNGASFVNPAVDHSRSVFMALGGYGGNPLPPATYLGWGLIIVLLAGTVVWFRDRRLWFYGLLLVTCVACSFGIRKGNWVPARVFAHIPLVENIIVQRFMIVGFLAAAVMLAVIMDRVRYALPRRLSRPDLLGRLAGTAAGLGVGAVALVPIAINFLPDLPFTMEAVVLPRWYATVAPKLPAGRVLLSYPVPFSGIQVAMAWQAVNRMSYSQAGGGGPQGTSARAGRARPGYDVLVVLTFGFSAREPSSTPANLAAVRSALAIWKVNTVVIDPQPSGSLTVQGHDPSYAAAYMTAVLGRLPVIQAGAWVWDDVHVGPGSTSVAGRITDSHVQGCVRQGETRNSRGVVTASLRVPRCVVAAEQPDGPKLS